MCFLFTQFYLTYFQEILSSTLGNLFFLIIHQFLFQIENGFIQGQLYIHELSHDLYILVIWNYQILVGLHFDSFVEYLNDILYQIVSDCYYFLYVMVKLLFFHLLNSMNAFWLFQSFQKLDLNGLHLMINIYMTLLMNDGSLHSDFEDLYP